MEVLVWHPQSLDDHQVCLGLYEETEGIQASYIQRRGGQKTSRQLKDNGLLLLKRYNEWTVRKIQKSPLLSILVVLNPSPQAPRQVMFSGFPSNCTDA